jgi:hypothetical protein
MGTQKTKFKLFKDILKERTKYSQGRVYLFGSIIAYYVTLAILTYSGIRKDDIDMENFKMIVEALEYALTLFAGYVFGGKAIEIIKVLKSPKSESTDADSTDDNQM